MKVFIYWVEMGYISEKAVVVAPSEAAAKVAVEGQYKNNPNFKGLVLEEELEVQVGVATVVYSHAVD